MLFSKIPGRLTEIVKWLYRLKFNVGEGVSWVFY